MRDLFWLVSFYLTRFKNRILNPGRETLIKNTLVLIFAAMFFPVIYQLFYFVFNHFYSVPIIGGLLINKLISTFFLTFSIMVILSSIVAAIPVLYLSHDMDFLFSSPIKADTIFSVQCVKIIAGASWMIILMGIPIFGAYMAVMKISLMQYFFILFCHVPFFIILSSAGIMATVILVRFFPAENVRNIAIALSGIFAVVFIIYFRMLQPEKLTGAGFDQVSDFIKNLRTPDAFWMPHAYFTAIVKKVTAGGIAEGLGPFLYFLSASLFTLAAVIQSSKYLYFEGYGKKGARKKEKPLSVNYRYTKHTAFTAQSLKDMKYLTRDTSQWIQVVFLAGIIFIYLFNLYKLPAELFGLRDFIFFLNIGFIGMVLAAVGSRFILPVISIEGKGFWIFKTAPVTMEKYVMRKFFTYSIPVVLTGQFVSVMSIMMLKPGLFVNYLTLYSTFCITVVIASAGTGLGAYFADFNIKNPEDLITGAAGLAYMFLTFIYVAIVLVLEAPVVKDYYMAALVKAKPFIPGDYMVNYILIFLLAAGISVPVLMAGIKKLKYMEN
jgi:ABC-2 type transport system permease protein